MPRHRSHRKRHHRRMRGGSATSFGEQLYGSGDAQFSRVFDQAGAFGQVPGNVIIGTQGQNVIPASQMPTSAQLNLVQSAGRRRRGSRRSRRGGFLGEVVNQAVVPLAILGMQQTYRRKRGGRRTRRRSHRRH